MPRECTVSDSLNLIDRFDSGKDAVLDQLKAALHGCDDGELYVEYGQSEGLVFDNGKLKTGNFSTDQGFGLRAVLGETSAYAHSGEFSLSALKRASDAVSAVRSGHGGSYAAAPQGTNRRLYDDINPIGAPAFEEKVKILEQIDAYARGLDPRVRQVSASIGASWQVVEILRADGHMVRDIRPLVRVNVT
ncbi:MAG: metalloprotease TldD, partial [Nitratireductor sp.]|nr:metalloprotease TldD [Nitratireductor sp.]